MLQKTDKNPVFQKRSAEVRSSKIYGSAKKSSPESKLRIMEKNENLCRTGFILEDSPTSGTKADYNDTERL